jgi:NADP-dependent 3-hydroxy acid dehydrogenase YdfG
VGSKDKVWFITGCSTGFGRELAKKTIEAGYKVVVTARNKAKIEGLVSNSQKNAIALTLDVTDKSQVSDAVKKALEKFGRIDVLVNNAGIGYFSSAEESIEKETRRMFEINFWGLMDVTTQVLPYMRKQRSGHILNFSSIGGLKSFPTLGYYNATKYAVEGISEALVQELEPFGIEVTLVEPSGFRTDWAGRSSIKTQTSIEDYRGTIVEQRLAAASQGGGQEAGDPVKAAQALIDVVESKDPPRHLLLGKMAYEGAYGKIEALKKDFEAWKGTTLGADYE